ncbi:hypothetical protein POM88_013003 [Heracleum sosnowskyi]|uniref:Uncharacterized protein n=1 Tax=Heracleum sosnowskyi TaxID=360622 RepID=A0AAD8N300_9APIA|nr:hypothetical protein POM88_013003 [Heracleum sosnowskyi]
MPEVQPFIREFDAHMGANDPQISNETLELLQKSEFKSWFRQKVENDVVKYELFKHLINGPVMDYSSDDEDDVTGISDDEGDIEAGRETNDEGEVDAVVEEVESDGEGSDGEGSHEGFGNEEGSGNEAGSGSEDE